MTNESAEENSLRTVTYLAEFESLGKVREFVGRAGESCGLDRADIYAVQMAVDEAFTNIIEHAFGGECQEEIECTCQIDKDRLTIVLRDCGQPFNPKEVGDPNLSTNLEERKVGGLGLYFMRQLMDEVSFSFVPASGDQEGCNTLKMVKWKEHKT